MTPLPSGLRGGDPWDILDRVSIIILLTTVPIARQYFYFDGVLYV
jgi:hypothetical protein